MAWLQKIVLKFVVPECPVFLLTDGHKSHINLDVIDACRENNIILFFLSPYTTHALQPLDVAVFKSLKDCFAKCVRAFSFTKKFFVDTKREFSHVVKRSLYQAFSITNIKAKSGIYPFYTDSVAKHNNDSIICAWSWIIWK